MVMTKQTCENCSGSGFEIGIGGLEDCPDCGGSGTFEYDVKEAPKKPEPIASATEPKPKMLTPEQVREAAELLELHTSFVKQLNEVFAAKTVAAFTVDQNRYPASWCDVLLLPIKALHVQQELKVRRRLAKLNVEVYPPIVLSQLTIQDYEALEEMAKLLGKPFDEE